MYLYPFQRHFRLDLIPASHSDISLCDLVWKRKNKSPLLGRKGMPNNLYNLFLAEDFITDTQWREAITSFESEKLISAQLGNLVVKANRRFGSSFQHPVVQYFHSESHFSNNLQFYFTDIRVRVLSNSWRIKIQTHLEKFNKKLEKKIFKRYRSIFLITELYYGNIRIQKTVHKYIVPTRFCCLLQQINQLLNTRMIGITFTNSPILKFLLLCAWNR